ncbi:MAG: GerMN domain-containing protein [Clostridiaceae bacterium]|nr:GerMN domain-containing protein [Clostridiaceae bacterium]
MKRVLLILAALCILAACGDQSTVQEDGKSTYKIYYLNPGMTHLVSQEYQAEETDAGRLVIELMNQFRTAPKDVDCQISLSEKVEFQKYELKDHVLYLYFDNNYTNVQDMKATREILCRAALTKTFTQIPGVEYININVGDQPLMDGTGVPVGMLSPGDFIESISDVNSFEKTEITLYFTDEAGEQLFAEQRYVVHTINTSLEKMIIEQLINGPVTEGLQPTLSKDVKLLNVSVNKNICYINFDSAFLNSTLEVKDYIPIYSIVNSLTELTTVNKVQISINGSQDAVYKDSISLNTLFERKTDLGGVTN